MGKVTTVRELERTNTSIVTSLYNFLCNFCILMIKDGHHSGRTNLIQYCDFIKFTHLFIYDLTIYDLRLILLYFISILFIYDLTIQLPLLTDFL